MHTLKLLFHCIIPPTFVDTLLRVGSLVVTTLPTQALPLEAFCFNCTAHCLVPLKTEVTEEDFTCNRSHWLPVALWHLAHQLRGEEFFLPCRPQRL